MKPLITSTYPTRYAAFANQRRIVVFRRTRTAPLQGMEAVVYADFRTNPFWEGVTDDDGVYVEVIATRRGSEWSWLVDASATAPTEHREQTRAHTRCSTLDQALPVVRREIERLTKWIESKPGAKAKSS